MAPDFFPTQQHHLADFVATGHMLCHAQKGYEQNLGLSEECESSRPTSFRAAPNSFRATFGALPNRRRGPSKIGGMGHTMCVPNPSCAPGLQSAANEIHSADGSICLGAGEDGHPCACGSIFSRGCTCSQCWFVVNPLRFTISPAE